MMMREKHFLNADTMRWTTFNQTGNTSEIIVTKKYSSISLSVFLFLVMREARKRKAVSYAESTSGDGSDDEEIASHASSESEENSSSDDSMDLDEEDESLGGDHEDSSNGDHESDDRPKKKTKTSPAKSPAAKNGPTTKVSTKQSPARGKLGSSTSKKESSTKKGVVAAKDSSGAVGKGPITNQNSTVSKTTVNSNMTVTSTGMASDITQGPPVSTDAGAKKLVTQYMRQQNRPYSAQQIFDNLHKRIPKATLERVLTLLSGPGEGLLCKEYGKAKIYYVDQSFLPSEKSPEQLQALQQNVLEFQEEFKGKVQEEKERRQQLNSVRSQPDDKDLDR